MTIERTFPRAAAAGVFTHEPYSNRSGPVRITNGPMGAMVEYRPAYTDSELAAIVRQGKDRPRPLSLDETTLAANNRRAAREDLLAMETWYRFQCHGAPDWKARHPGSIEVWARTVADVRSDRWR